MRVNKVMPGILSFEITHYPNTRCCLVSMKDLTIAFSSPLATNHLFTDPYSLFTTGSINNPRNIYTITQQKS